MGMARTRGNIVKRWHTHGVWFVSYEYCKTELFTRSKGGGMANEIAIPMISGGFAATAAWLVGYPFDLIKTRIQAGTGRGVISTARDLVNEANGRVIHGLYRGFGLKLLRSIPASAIGFLTYETASKALC
jgi:solute carrier family 25 carnitine/acylcarnitine transporter 20/29